jgi:hypothetical protein
MALKYGTNTLKESSTFKNTADHTVFVSPSPDVYLAGQIIEQRQVTVSRPPRKVLWHFASLLFCFCLLLLLEDGMEKDSYMRQQQKLIQHKTRRCDCDVM